MGLSFLGVFFICIVCVGACQEAFEAELRNWLVADGENGGIEWDRGYEMRVNENAN